MPDYARLDPWSVASWARQANDERHRNGDLPGTGEVLATVENILLINRRPNTRRLAHPLQGRLWVACRPTVYVLLLLPPAFAPFAMPAGQYVAGVGTYKPERAFFTALAVCLLGMAYLAFFYRRWRPRLVRRRDDVAALFSCIYAGATAFGLVLCHVFADDFDVPIDWYVLPLWILLVLCIDSVVYQATSPPNPVWGNVLTMGGEMSPAKVRLDVHRLHPEDRARMLDERDQAVRILIERGLLTGVDPDELSTRPLGELHLEPGATHARHH